MTASFADLQTEFQRCILERDDTILAELLDGSQEQRATLFEVYRHAYVGRLVDVLRNNHPLLHSYLGDDDFDEMARAYIAANPSRHPNLRWHSHKLPAFLRTTEPYSEYALLHELAQIEIALDDAFDAPDTPVLALERLHTIPPEAWSDICFVGHESSRRIDATTNAFAIWSALRDEETPPEPETYAAPMHLIVWRQDTTSMIREMPDEEAMMWDEAANDVPFAVLCTMLATYDDPDGAAARAAGYLQGWIAAEMLTRVAYEG